jgi:hypothetical protein
MSNNRIKSCECFRFPSGTAMCASERIRQKANIQIYKNNVLLNCKDQNSRVYSGTHNRLRSINGFKLHEESKANSDCGGNPDCIFSDKKAADYWIVGKPSAAALCPNRETITLEQALAQGGVLDCQDLVITQPSSISTEKSNIIAGLVIETGNTFTIAKTGKVTIATDIAATGADSAVGIFVKSNGNLINNGTITFKGAISGQIQANGIANGGSFESNGAITFEGAISSQTIAYGIFNGGSFETNGAITFENAISGQGGAIGIADVQNGSFEQSDGAIKFEGTISGQFKAEGIVNTGSFEQSSGTITFEGTIISSSGAATGILNAGSFEQSGGTITFEDAISSSSDNAAGILNQGSGSFEQSGGTITFEGAISSQGTTGIIIAAGILIQTGSSFQTNGAIKFEGSISGDQFTFGIFNGESFQTNGAITFKGAIIDGQTQPFGISNKGSLFETNGTIRFEVNNLTSTNFDPQNASTNITGTGTITYGTNPVNTYY